MYIPGNRSIISCQPSDSLLNYTIEEVVENYTGENSILKTVKSVFTRRESPVCNRANQLVKHGFPWQGSKTGIIQMKKGPLDALKGMYSITLWIKFEWESAPVLRHRNPVLMASKQLSVTVVNQSKSCEKTILLPGTRTILWSDLPNSALRFSYCRL